MKNSVEQTVKEFEERGIVPIVPDAKAIDKTFEESGENRKNNSVY